MRKVAVELKVRVASGADLINPRKGGPKCGADIQRFAKHRRGGPH